MHSIPLHWIRPLAVLCLLAPSLPAQISYRKGAQSSGTNPAATLFHKEGKNLVEGLEKNFYGPSDHPAAIQIRGTEISYQPSDERDHLATPFFTLPFGWGRTKEIGIELKGVDASSKDLSVTLQNGRYETIAAWHPADRKPSSSTWSRVTKVALGDVKIRLVFSSTGLVPVQLPSEVLIWSQSSSPVRIWLGILGFVSCGVMFLFVCRRVSAKLRRSTNNNVSPRFGAVGISPDEFSGLTSEQLDSAVPSIHLIVIALSAVVVLLVDRTLPYPPVGSIDPWVYYGYFFDYPNYVAHFFANLYYGTRLPWILPGYLVIHIFSPLVGTFAFVLAVFYAAVYGFYFALRLLFNPAVALAGTLLLATDFYFLHALAWYYVDGGVVLYFIYSLLFLALMHRRSDRRFVFLFGWTCTSMVLCHFMAVVLVPCLAACFAYLVWTGRQWKNNIGSAVRFLFLGVSACIALFEAINFSVTKHLIFFLPQLEVVLHTSSIITDYKLPLRTWLPIAHWIVIPLVSILLGLTMALQLKARTTFRGIQGVAVFSSLLTLLMLLVAEAGGLFYYQIYYYTSFLLPICYLIITAALYKVTNEKNVSALLMSAFILILYWLRAREHYQIVTSIIRDNSWAYVAIGGAAIAGAASLLTIWSKHRRLRMTIFILGIAVCSLSDGGPEDSSAQTQWHLLYRSHQAIERVSGARMPRLWYSAGDRDFLVWRSLASMYLWRFSIVNEAYPNAYVQGFNPLQPGDLVVICSETSGLNGEVTQEFAEHGFLWHGLHQEHIESGGRGFWMNIGEVQRIVGLAVR